MDHPKLVAQFQAQIMRESPGLSTRLPSHIRIVANDWAMVTGTTLTLQDADDAILAEVALFRTLNRDFEWKVYSWDTPSDLKERLVRNGFQQGDEEALMVFDLAQDIGHWESPHQAVKVSTNQHIEDFRSVEHQLGSERSFLNEVIDSLQRGDNEAMGFVAYLEERPVSIARLNCHPESPFGGCYGGSTLPEFRRMGFYRSLLLARAQEAKRLGVQYLQVDSLPTSRPILERLGFEQIGSTWPFTWSPG
ncbi:MAG: hypothetical protein H7Y17_10480 [Chlorobia bacterium]|nr:hypothetical protein [Fimbriimonadaceae bacterium]